MNGLDENCIKLSTYIEYLQKIYKQKGDLDLYSWSGKVTDLENFTEIDDDVIIVDLKGIDTVD